MTADHLTQCDIDSLTNDSRSFDSAWDSLSYIEEYFTQYDNVLPEVVVSLVQALDYGNSSVLR